MCCVITRDLIHLFAFVLDRKVYYILENYQKLRYAMFIFLHSRGVVL